MSPFERVYTGKLPDQVTRESDIPQIIEKFRKVCESLGLSLKHGSPIWQLISSVEKLSVALDTGSASVDLLKQGGDFFWLHRIFTSSKDTEWLKPFVAHLEDHKRYASIFLELRYAIVALDAGWTAIPSEPDLVLSIFGEKLGVACKRLRSARALVPRFKDAVHQIERSSLDGIVIIDLSLLASEKIRFAKPDDWYRRAESLIRQMAENSLPEMREYAKKKRVSSVIFRFGECVLIGARPPFTSFSPERYIPVTFRNSKPWVMFNNTLKSCYGF